MNMNGMNMNVDDSLKTFKYGKCVRECQQNATIDMPRKAFTEPGSVVESDGSKCIENACTIAARRLCYFCFSIGDETTQIYLRAYGMF